MAVEGTELIMLGIWGCAGRFWLSGRLKSEGLTLGNWFLERSLLYFKRLYQFIELKRIDTGKDIIEKERE